MKAYRTLLTVCHDECRYVIGEANGADTLFCGDPTIQGKSYCAKHAAKVFLTPEEEPDLDELTKVDVRWSPLLHSWIAVPKTHRRTPTKSS